MRRRKEGKEEEESHHQPQGPRSQQQQQTWYALISKVIVLEWSRKENGKKVVLQFPALEVQWLDGIPKGKTKPKNKNGEIPWKDMRKDKLTGCPQMQLLDSYSLVSIGTVDSLVHCLHNCKKCKLVNEKGNNEQFRKVGRGEERPKGRRIRHNLDNQYLLNIYFKGHERNKR